MKVLVVGGEKVENIKKALGSDENMVLEPVKYTEDLSDAIKKTGQINKIVILEMGINSKYNLISKAVGDIKTIIVMSDEKQLFDMSVEVFSHANISLVNKAKPYTVEFMKDIIVAEKLKPEYLYKGKRFGNNPETKKAAIKIETPSDDVLSFDINEPTQKVEESKNNNFNIEEDDIKGFEVKQEEAVKKVEKAKIEKPTIVIQDELSQAEKVKKELKFYKNGFVLAMCGTNNSGTTTTVYNLGNIIADMGLNVLLVDCDFYKQGLGYVSKEVFEAINSKNLIDKDDIVVQAIKSSDVQTNAQIIRDNLFVLSGHICGEIALLQPLQRYIKQFLEAARKDYDVIIFDTNLPDINRCPDIFLNADEVCYTINRDNKSFYEFLRMLTNINDEEVAKRCFDASVIYFGQGHNVMFQNSNSMRAIDDFLFNKYEICGDKRFEDLIEVGTIPYIEGVDEMMNNRNNLFKTHKQMYIDLLDNILNKEENI